jgi:ceramide glucosyltransferase
MTIAMLALLCLWISMAGLNLYGTILAVRHFGKHPRAEERDPKFPPISILKPLKGMENGIRENLETFFHLDYPQYEIIFSVADGRDPACNVVRSLMASHPSIRARLIVGDVEAGTNPKVNNMVRSYAAAEHDHLLVSDCSVKVDPSFLYRIVSHLGPKTGIVTAAGTGSEAKGLGGQLEVTYLNTFYARWMMIATTAGMPTVVGHTMLFRRSTADRFGGIRNLACFLAEDYMSGQAMKQLGLEVRIMTEPVFRTVGKQAFEGFWNRHVRWGRMRKCHAPIPFYFEWLSFAVPSGIIGSWAAYESYGWNPLVTMAAHLFVWFLCDLTIMKKIHSKIDYLTPFWWLCREALSFPMWAHIVSGDTVNWRGSILRLQPGGTVVPTGELELSANAH